MAGEKWNLPKDSRKSGEKYPNFNVLKTVSGHIIQYDDSKGSESITIQHRTGSLLQFQSDGSLVFKNEKNKYEVTFGDHKVLISGVYDVTVNGGASLKVEGDYDVTVNGNYKLAVKGNKETLINGNSNTLIKGKKDTAINGSETVKVKGNYEHTSEGKTYVGSHTGLKVESTGDMLQLVASGELQQKGSRVSLAGETHLGVDDLGGSAKKKAYYSNGIDSSDSDSNNASTKVYMKEF